MSPKARRLETQRANPFVWADAGGGRELEPLPPAEPAWPDPAPRPDPDDAARRAAVEREAFATGYAQGERAGMEAGSKRADAMLRRLGETIAEIVSLRQTVLRQAERELVQLALVLARRVVRREVEADEEFLTAMARVALDRLGDARPAVIRLHPDDFVRVAPRQVEQWTSGQVTVVPDAGLTRGACLVESPFGSVDAGIDAQFQELARALLETEDGTLEMARVHG